MMNIFATKCIGKRQWIGFALWLCWGLLFWGAVNINVLKTIYPTASLRYETSLAGDAAANAREIAFSHSGGVSFWPTFWSEKLGVPAEGLHTATTRCLWFSGDAALVWSVTFLQGGYPAPLDSTACAMSDDLAFRLWANEDVLGHEVVIQQKRFTVCGIFEGKERLVMIGARRSL